MQGRDANPDGSGRVTKSWSLVWDGLCFVITGAKCGKRGGVSYHAWGWSIVSEGWGRVVYPVPLRHDGESLDGSRDFDRGLNWS